ncbi:uncharacterized protein [Malus domestica]|uniref:uncharacterized protein n=1 Tax=Malus domestica TaxID=3750 RepID=UPI003976C87D
MPPTTPTPTSAIAQTLNLQIQTLHFTLSKSKPLLLQVPPIPPLPSPYSNSTVAKVAQNEMEDDEDRRMRDDEARMARASHSRRVIQVVAQICRPSRSANLDRSRQQRDTELLDDYFVRNNAFPDTYFRRRYRMERHLFNKIMIAVCNHDSYFVQKNDAFGVMGFFPEQKIIATLRMLAYGTSTYQVDKIARMGKSTILQSLMRFCGAIKSINIVEYLRRPTNKDLQRLLKKGEM